MRMRNLARAALLALALPLSAGAQEARPPAPRSPEMREEMRERIRTRFLDLATERLELNATQRTRLAGVLDQNAEERREIAEEGMRLRREAADALADESPDAARAERILDELTRLRERELQLWRTEQSALADVLTPLQRLELMAMQARFNERVRDLRHRGGPGGARGEGGPGAGRPRGRAPGQGFGGVAPGRP